MKLQTLCDLLATGQDTLVEFARAPARCKIYHSDPNRKTHPSSSDTRGRHLRSLERFRNCRPDARECWQPSMVDADWIGIVSERASHSRTRPPDRGAAPRLQGQLDQTVSSVRCHQLRDSLDASGPLRHRMGRRSSSSYSGTPVGLMGFGLRIYANPVSQRDLCDSGILQSGSRTVQPSSDSASRRSDCVGTIARASNSKENSLDGCVATPPPAAGSANATRGTTRSRPVARLR